MDVTKAEDINNSIRELEEGHGPVDVLISNAGMSQRGSVNDSVIDVHHSLMKINYFGQVNLVKGILIRQNIFQKSSYFASQTFKRQIETSNLPNNRK